jgi:hypothetical protein
MHAHPTPDIIHEHIKRKGYRYVTITLALTIINLHTRWKYTYNSTLTTATCSENYVTSLPYIHYMDRNSLLLQKAAEKKKPLIKGC